LFSATRSLGPEAVTTACTTADGTSPAAPSSGVSRSPAVPSRLAVRAAVVEHAVSTKDIFHTLGVGTIANHTECLRAELERLVTRGVIPW
jgi:hypothetical protein